MTRDDIMKMAKAAGFADTFDDVHAFYKLEDFASSVVAHERESFLHEAMILAQSEQEHADECFKIEDKIKQHYGVEK